MPKVLYFKSAEFSIQALFLSRERRLPQGMYMWLRESGRSILTTAWDLDRL